MEKLLNLLNEHLGQTNIVVIEQEIEGRRDIFFENEDGFHVEEAEIISKKFGFIQWLIKNDKIDIESYCRITSVEKKGEKDVYRDEVDSLLMLLAIQDGPIEFLCSIIK